MKNNRSPAATAPRRYFRRVGSVPGPARSLFLDLKRRPHDRRAGSSIPTSGCRTRDFLLRRSSSCKLFQPARTCPFQGTRRPRPRERRHRSGRWLWPFRLRRRQRQIHGVEPSRTPDDGARRFAQGSSLKTFLAPAPRARSTRDHRFRGLFEYTRRPAGGTTYGLFGLRRTLCWLCAMALSESALWATCGHSEAIRRAAHSDSILLLVGFFITTPWQATRSPMTESMGLRMTPYCQSTGQLADVEVPAGGAHPEVPGSWCRLLRPLLAKATYGNVS